jgi:hypothetical protein
MDLVSKQAGDFHTLGTFGLSTDYAITGIAGTVLTVAEDVSAVFADGDKLLIVSGTGVGEIYTVASAVYDTDHTDITVDEALGIVVVTDTLCFTKVPATSGDNVNITHAVTAAASVVVGDITGDFVGSGGSLNVTGSLTVGDVSNCFATTGAEVDVSVDLVVGDIGGSFATDGADISVSGNITTGDITGNFTYNSYVSTYGSVIIDGAITTNFAQKEGEGTCTVSVGNDVTITGSIGGSFSTGGVSVTADDIECASIANNFANGGSVTAGFITVTSLGGYFAYEADINANYDVEVTLANTMASFVYGDASACTLDCRNVIIAGISTSALFAGLLVNVHVVNITTGNINNALAYGGALVYVTGDITINGDCAYALAYGLEDTTYVEAYNISITGALTSGSGGGYFAYNCAGVRAYGNITVGSGVANYFAYNTYIYVAGDIIINGSLGAMFLHQTSFTFGASSRVIITGSISGGIQDDASTFKPPIFIGYRDGIATLTVANIKKDVNIAGVVGTLESTDPGVVNVKKDVAYKIDSVSKTGTLESTDPGIANVKKDVTYKIESVSKTGTLVDEIITIL